MTGKDLSILSEKNVADLLVFMLDAARKENDFTQVVSNYYSINATLGRIVAAGLATVTTDESRYRTRWYELTPLGHDVASDLKRAMDRINGISHPEDIPMDYEAPSEEGHNVS